MKLFSPISVFLESICVECIVLVSAQPLVRASPFSSCGDRELTGGEYPRNYEG